MSNVDICALNHVTRTLIDSSRGYEMACEMVDENNIPLRRKLIDRAEERRRLVARCQSEVRILGGDPETDGGMVGNIHRAFTRFSCLFQDDQHAAFRAIDDGEEFLIDDVEDKLKKPDLDRRTRQILEAICECAREGEDFAHKLAKAA
ncbi:PA2169 family four-helix-bundle protein [Ponticaulis profundi]|uniref:PA2169 family four-helix-bundle protein n=1 Tax=Ponticaulis profundi TaxID=2665222 RepID=A0ABW1SAV8_9PROT